jgi:hypothetical protein
MHDVNPLASTTRHLSSGSASNRRKIVIALGRDRLVTYWKEQSDRLSFIQACYLGRVTSARNSLLPNMVHLLAG